MNGEPMELAQITQHDVLWVLIILAIIVCIVWLVKHIR